MQQNATWKGNTPTGIMKFTTESLKFKSKNREIASGGHKLHLSHMGELTYTIPVVINGIITMNNSDISASSGNANTDTAVQKKTHSVVTISDSYAGGCASKVKDNLGDKFMVNGFVKPSVGIDTLASTAKGDIGQLTKEDVLVFWGGTNDAGKNNCQDGLTYLVNFVKNNSHTNIIVMCAPHRHDLVDWSCVNEEVRNFNRKLVKLMKAFMHVRVVKIDLDRELFTKHGLHMNNLGKERIMKHTATMVLAVLQKKTQEPISIHWKTNQEDDHDEVTGSDYVVTQEVPYDASLTGINEENSADEGNPKGLLGKVKGKTDHLPQLMGLQESIANYRRVFRKARMLQH
jgi:hypothetical protein